MDNIFYSRKGYIMVAPYSMFRLSYLRWRVAKPNGLPSVVNNES